MITSMVTNKLFWKGTMLPGRRPNIEDKPLLCAVGAGVNAGGFAIGGLKSFKYYIINQLSYMTLVVLHTYQHSDLPDPFTWDGGEDVGVATPA